MLLWQMVWTGKIKLNKIQMQQTEALKIYGSVMRDDSAVILMTNVHGRPSAFSGPKQDFICGPKKFLTLLKNNN